MDYPKFPTLKIKITKAWLPIDLNKNYLMATKTHRYHNSRGTPCRPVITSCFQQKNPILRILQALLTLWEEP